MTGDNFSIDHPEIHKAVEQLLTDFSYDECMTLSNRLKHRVEWLVKYWENNDY